MICKIENSHDIAIIAVLSALMILHLAKGQQRRQVVVWMLRISAHGFLKKCLRRLAPKCSFQSCYTDRCQADLEFAL